MQEAKSSESAIEDEDEMVELDYEIIRIPFTSNGGCIFVKCGINDLPSSFIFDTRTDSTSLSIDEANFMLKNGYLETEDFIESQRFVDSNGDILEGTVVNLRNVDFGCIIP